MAVGSVDGPTPTLDSPARPPVSLPLISEPQAGGGVGRRLPPSTPRGRARRRGRGLSRRPGGHRPPSFHPQPAGTGERAASPSFRDPRHRPLGRAPYRTKREQTKCPSLSYIKKLVVVFLFRGLSDRPNGGLALSAPHATGAPKAKAVDVEGSTLRLSKDGTPGPQLGGPGLGRPEGRSG